MILENLSIDQVLIKAKSYVQKGELVEAQKLYDAILKNLSKNIIPKERLATLNKPNQNNDVQSLPQEVINQLVALYNQGQLSTVIKQAEILTQALPRIICYGMEYTWGITFH